MCLVGGGKSGMGTFDRKQRHKRLAEQLQPYASQDAVVLGTSVGGLAAAIEVAATIAKPLDVVEVRKLEVPYRPELELGVVADPDVTVIDRAIAKEAHITNGVLNETLRRARNELQSSLADRDESSHSLDGRTAVVVDDGEGPWFSAFAACQVARARGAERVIVAVPGSPKKMRESFRGHADEVVLVDEQGASGGRAPTDVRIPALSNGKRLGVSLPGVFSAPADAQATVVIARGANIDGNSARDGFIADSLNANGFATLMFDLLVDNDPHLNGADFEIDKFSARVMGAVDWARSEMGESTPVGVYGSSTGAAIALWAAADPDSKIDAVVSRGGLLGLVTHRLDMVVAPTLLLVGGEDHRVFQGNHEAAERLLCPHALCVINNMADLYADPTAVDAVARQSISWFRQWLAPAAVVPRIPTIPGRRRGRQSQNR